MSFSIAIMKDPIFYWDENLIIDNWNEKQGDHHLEFEFDGKDFDELQNFLDLKLPPAKQGDGENSQDFDERLKKENIEAAREKGFEMLGRIWFWYESVTYLPTEINRLLEECLKFEQQSRNPDQSIAAGKLIAACKDALENNSGIFLGSD